MGELDVTFRKVLRDLPESVLQLAFPYHPIEPTGAFDSSVDRPRQRTSDGLLRVRDRDGEAAVHVEIEREWRSELASRLFDYASSAATGTQLPVWSVLLLLRPGGAPPQGVGVYRIRGIDGDAFVFRYRVVPLWQLDARAMLRQLGLIGAPLCVAMQGANHSFVAEVVDEVLADPGLSLEARQRTIRLLYLVTVVILGIDTAQRIFMMEWLMEDPNIQDMIRWWMDKGRVEGEAEGRAAGQAEGRAAGQAEGRAAGQAEGRAAGQAEGRAAGQAEGRATEARRMLCKVLAARSFAMPRAVHDRIERETDVARLEMWLEAAVVAPSIDDVFASARS